MALLHAKFVKDSEGFSARQILGAPTFTIVIYSEAGRRKDVRKQQLILEAALSSNNERVIVILGLTKYLSAASYFPILRLPWSYYERRDSGASQWVMFVIITWR